MLFLFNCAFADDIRIIKSGWQKINDFCDVNKMSVNRTSTGGRFDLYFLRFNPQKIKIKILTGKNCVKMAQTADTLAQKSGAFCVINGGFFDENYNPIGVLMTGGKVLQYLPTVGNSSVFYVKGGVPYIIHMKDFSYKGVEEALQSGPRLMYDGKNTKGVFGADAVSRRSGIAFDYDNNLIIYAADTIFDGLSFNELREILRRPEINVKTALNLDGGKSTQLYFNLNGHRIDVTGFDYIPVGIGIFGK